MILLVTSSHRSSELKQAIERELAITVHASRNSQDALLRLRKQEYEAVLIDQSVSYEPESEALIQHCGTAVPVTINSALSNCSRIIIELKTALRRRRADRMAAHRAAGRELREDLRNALTGILLNSELALNASSVPAAQTRLRQVLELAEGMKRKLEI